MAGTSHRSRVKPVGCFTASDQPAWKTWKALLTNRTNKRLLGPSFSSTMIPTCQVKLSFCSVWKILKDGLQTWDLMFLIFSSTPCIINDKLLIRQQWRQSSTLPGVVVPLPAHCPYPLRSSGQILDSTYTLKPCQALQDHFTRKYSAVTPPRKHRKAPKPLHSTEPAMLAQADCRDQLCACVRARAPLKLATSAGLHAIYTSSAHNWSQCACHCLAVDYLVIQDKIIIIIIIRV